MAQYNHALKAHMRSHDLLPWLHTMTMASPFQDPSRVDLVLHVVILEVSTPTMQNHQTL